MESESEHGAVHVPPAGLPRALPLIRVIAMLADANPNGDIFGGWLLSQMDLAGGSLAARRARGDARRWPSTAWSSMSRSLSGTRSAATANSSRQGAAR
jgi:hypothetical protein